MRGGRESLDLPSPKIKSARGVLIELSSIMPKRWTIQAGIVALGAVVAVGTMQRTTTYLPQPSVVHQVAAGDSIARVKMSSLVAASSAPAPVSTSELNINVDHPRVDYWVTRLTTSMKSGFETTLGRMDKYSAMITTKLEAKDLPKELIYLALIESEFNPNAKSRVKAVGMWQFMSGTAKQYGLAVGRKVDERKNPKLSTDAAIKYLSGLHDRLGSWYLAAAAYNSGEGTVRKALRNTIGKTEGTDADFFRIMSKLPKETQDYVPKLIAAARVGSDPVKYGLNVE
jgi:membrane-bound lytic murein transglycosylase D